MKVQFYIDIFFAVNGIMDFLLLCFVRWIRKLKVRMSRIVLSAVTGALISSCLVILPIGRYKVAIFVAGTLISVLMVVIAFGCHELQGFICNYTIFLSGSFFFGGIIKAVTEGFTTESYYNPVYHGTMKSITLTILIVVSFVLTPIIYYVYYLVSHLKEQESDNYHVRITLKEGCVIECEGFMDSGNGLYEPITGYPVIVANEQMITSKLKGKMEMLSERFCVVPYSSIGKRDGVLNGFRADSVELWQKTEKEVIFTRHVVIALTKQGFAKKKDDIVLLHRDLLRI